MRLQLKLEVTRPEYEDLCTAYSRVNKKFESQVIIEDHVEYLGAGKILVTVNAKDDLACFELGKAMGKIVKERKDGRDKS